MNQQIAAALSLLLAISNPLGGSAHSAAEQDPTDEAAWSYSSSVTTYIAEHDREYASPTIAADLNSLHLELRYNYEALKTGSIFAGYNLTFGKKVQFEVMPMIGGVLGDINGVAPGYTISIASGPIEFYTQGEYFFDGRGSEGNFFYNWTELSISPARWIRVGVALDRTKVVNTDIEIRRGPLLGFRYKQFDFTTYWLAPGREASTFVFSANVDF
jgi:hypothetical protein